MGAPLLMMAGLQSWGIAALSVGDARGAHEQLGPMAQAVLVAGMTEPALYRFVPDEIEALIRLGDLDRAESLLNLLCERSVRLQRGWGVATAARCRGLLLCARGDAVAADTEVESALATVRALSMPFEEARTLLIAGEVNRRARRKHRAASLLREAAGMFERLGAPLWAARAGSELDRVGLRSTPATCGTALSTAEQRVVDLVLMGRTNNEIAGELFMARRTVEAHLSRVYSKLSVRSRTELCATRSDSTPSRNVRESRIRGTGGAS
jgi:DNA-binding CsgD family transcriptional regulator